MAETRETDAQSVAELDNEITRRSRARSRSIRTALLVAAVLVIVVAAVLVIVEPFATTTSTRASVRPVPFQRGVTIAAWGTRAYAGDAFGELVRSLKARGVDTVTLLVVWRQDTQDSVAITPDSHTVSTANLANAINTAHAAGLRVILKPHIDVRAHIYRGKITPNSVAQWFASYDAFILRYAKLAQEEHVQGFVVGTELTTMQPYANQWRALIHQVRQVYRTGFVTYDANHASATKITWWDALDVISVSAYYALNHSGSYAVPDLIRGWSNPYRILASLHRKYHRDVMFGEIGYTPYTRTFAEPWLTAPLGTYSTAAQANGYTAGFDVWWPVPWFKGFEPWYISSNPALLATQSGNHEPRAPALEVLSHWYLNKQPAGS